MLTPGKAVFVVRAEVPDQADRAGFDRWYAAEHLPDALKAFGCERAWRGWSALDPAVHIAFYEFASLAAAQAATAPDKLKPLIAEFDRAWGERVKRARDIVELAQT